MFEVLGAGGRAGDHDIVPGAALTEAVAEETVGHDLVLERPSRFGLGFQLTLPERPIGRSPRGFGHFGAGGSLGYCDPEDALAFAYVTNDMGPRWQNPRNQGLTAAIHDSLG
jgi:CubicO group peptidase (beta-lactamase class C family)